MKFILFLILFFHLEARAESAPERFQVCSMTLNSSDELDVFRGHLDPDRFSFIELVPPHHQVESYDEGRWLSQVCPLPQLKCDILIVSGHFAGMFFGTDNDYVLPMSELEQLACRKSCPRVLGNLKEVYLFGCNTMANKKNSSRTPSEYLNVLVEEHEMARDLAEMVVAGRYSIFGPSFKDKMEHIFSKKTKIYGFPDLSPLGSQARPLLKNYFRSIKNEYGSFYEYLNQTFYLNPKAGKENKYFSEAFSPVSSVEQGRGFSSSHSRKRTYNRICSLHDESKPELEKLKTVKKLLRKGEGLFAFSAIKTFLIERGEGFSGSSLSLFEEIKEMSNEKEKFLKAYSEMNRGLSYIRSQVLHFLKTLGWVNSSYYQKELRSTLLPLVDRPSRQSFDILNALVTFDKLNPSDIGVEYDDLQNRYLQNIWSVLMVDTLRFRHPQMARDLMNYCILNMKKDLVICYQVLKTLGHLGVQDPEIISVMKGFLGSQDAGLVYYSTYALAYLKVGDPYIHLEIFNNLYHGDPWIRLQSLKTLEFLGLIGIGSKAADRLIEVYNRETDERVRKEISNILKRSVFH